MWGCVRLWVSVSVYIGYFPVRERKRGGERGRVRLCIPPPLCFCPAGVFCTCFPSTERKRESAENKGGGVKTFVQSDGMDTERLRLYVLIFLDYTRGRRMYASIYCAIDIIPGKRRHFELLLWVIDSFNEREKSLLLFLLIDLIALRYITFVRFS